MILILDQTVSALLRPAQRNDPFVDSGIVIVLKPMKERIVQMNGDRHLRPDVLRKCLGDIGIEIVADNPSNTIIIRCYANCCLA
ncbi:hypothetical protein D3C73_1480170 [compost metagenome]